MSFNEALARRDIELMSSPYENYTDRYDERCSRCINGTKWIYKGKEYCEECLKETLWEEHYEEIEEIKCGDKTEYLFRGQTMSEECIKDELFDDHYEELEEYEEEAEEEFDNYYD